MKKRFWAVLVLALIATCCVVAACTQVTEEYCTVTIEKGYGFTFDGSLSVKKGTDYTFGVSAEEGYELSSVTVGSVKLQSQNGKYTVQNVTENIEITVKTVRKSFVVLFVGEGFEVDGETKAEYGSNYAFELTIADGYVLAGDMPEVKVGGTTLVGRSDGSKYEYTVENVTDVLTITVSGIDKLPWQITLARELFDLQLNELTAEQKSEAYYLQGVSGSWQGANCDVTADLSEVDWTKNGAYDIVYTLAGHADCTRTAKIRLFAETQINDITVDLSDISTPVAELDGCQYVDRDIYLLSDEQTLLTPRQFVAEQTDVGGKHVFRSHFSAEYLSQLGAGSYEYKLVNYADCTVGKFALTLTDDAEPAFVVNASDEYAFVVGDSFDFPRAVKKNTSAQKIAAKYFLTDSQGKTTECTDGYTLPSKAGNYVWTIRYFRGETEVGNAREIKYLLVDNYGWSGVTVSASLDGNIVLSTVDNDPNQYTDKTAVLSNDYIAKYNKNNNNFVIVTFKVTEYVSSGKFDPGMWGLKGTNEYVGVGLTKVGTTQNIMRTLGNSVDFIIRDFTGSIEILSVDFVNIPDGIGTSRTDAGYIDAKQNENGLVSSVEVRWLTASSNSQFHISSNYIDKVAEAGYGVISAKLNATQQNIYVICTYTKDGKDTKVAANYTNNETLTAKIITENGTLTDIQMLIVNTHDSKEEQDFSGTLRLSVEYAEA